MDLKDKNIADMCEALTKDAIQKYRDTVEKMPKNLSEIYQDQIVYIAMLYGVEKIEVRYRVKRGDPIDIDIQFTNPIYDIYRARFIISSLEKKYLNNRPNDRADFLEYSFARLIGKYPYLDEWNAPSCNTFFMYGKIFDYMADKYLEYSVLSAERYSKPIFIPQIDKDKFDKFSRKQQCEFLTKKSLAEYEILEPILTSPATIEDPYTFLLGAILTGAETIEIRYRIKDEDPIDINIKFANPKCDIEKFKKRIEMLEKQYKPEVLEDVYYSCLKEYPYPISEKKYVYGPFFEYIKERAAKIAALKEKNNQPTL